MFRKLSSAAKPPAASSLKEEKKNAAFSPLIKTPSQRVAPEFVTKCLAKLPMIMTPQDKVNFLAICSPLIATCELPDPEWFNFDFAMYLIGVQFACFPPIKDESLRAYSDEYLPVFWGEENALLTRLHTLLSHLDLAFRSFPNYQVFCSVKNKPILSGKKEKIAVVAIDFGSTHSGFAFSLLRPPQLVCVSKKDPTAALFDRETMQLVSLGSEARETYMRYLGGDLFLNKFNQNGDYNASKQRYLYFEGDVKMRLWDDRDGSKKEEEMEARTCRTLGGKERAKLLDVVSKILARLKDDARMAVNQAILTSNPPAVLPPTPTLGGRGSDLGAKDQSVFSHGNTPGQVYQRHTGSVASTVSSSSSSSPSHPQHKQSIATLGSMSPPPPPAIKAEDILWVVTVPAIWREQDKQFMRKACFNAGIIDEPFSSELVLALEPECAALAARFDLPSLDVSPGQKLLVFDIGGGTCDVCAVEVLPGNKFACRLLLVPTGGNWGGTKVDDAFFSFITKLFGSDILDHCRKNAPACLIELHEQWERLKVGMTLEDFMDETGDRKKSIDVSYILQEATTVSLSSLCKQFNASALTDKKMFITAKAENMLSDATVLKLPCKFVRTFFDPVVDAIVNHASYLFRTFPTEMDSLKQILLVGGMGASPYLKYRFERVFPPASKFKVLNSSTMSSSSALVAFGAVKFGLQPAVIQARKARITLGVKATVEYNSQHHRGRQFRENKFFDRQSKKHYIRNVFKPFLVAGEEVEAEKVVVHKFQPPSADSDRVKFDVFTCDDRPPVGFVNEDGCRLLARIVVPVVKGEMPLLEVRLKIGFTEISAEVRKSETQEVILKRVLFEFHPDDDEAAKQQDLLEESAFERVQDDMVDDFAL